jgi:hypothetical protein
MKGWSVNYQDGKVVNEQDVDGWRSISKLHIKSMSIFWNDKKWTIEGKENYAAPTKRAYVTVGRNGSTIVSRTIGYYEGPYKIFYRVNEETGELTIEKYKDNVFIETSKP